MESMKTVDENKLREKLTEILRDEHYTIAGLARSMNLAPETLEAWHRGDFDGDSDRVERIMRSFMASRDAFWNAMKQGDARACDELRATAVLGLSETLSRLVRAAGCSREAELIEAQAHVLLRDLELASKAAIACSEVDCWRCGANVFPPPADLAAEIEKNVHLAQASGWDAETFRLRCREKMVAGDRIVKHGIGVFGVRRPDRTSFVVYRFDS